jgi:hypothetical protein
LVDPEGRPNRSRRFSTAIDLVWGRVIHMIHNFCRELVAALAGV